MLSSTVPLHLRCMTFAGRIAMHYYRDIVHDHHECKYKERADSVWE